MGVDQRADPQWGGKLQTSNNYRCRGKTRRERGVIVWVCWRMDAAESYQRKERCEKEAVGHTSGPGGPGNPTGPLSPTFPCRNQKNMEKSELAAGYWLSCSEQQSPAKLSSQLGTEPSERETRKQRTLGYLPGGLLSLVPQGPQANPGCPERDTDRFFFRKHNEASKNMNPPGSSPSSCSGERSTF